MAISLASLKSTASSSPPRILTYGVAGVGKTTFATSAPGVVVVPTEDGLGAKANDINPSPIAITHHVNRKVNLLTRAVDVMHRCGHSEIDVGMGLAKPSDEFHICGPY